jgi:hypothetical protein
VNDYDITNTDIIGNDMGNDVTSLLNEEEDFVDVI